jgi:RNA polymerase II subunit A small phosphatase-like protein
LVLDLDETLVHSSFTPTTNYDFIIPLPLNGQLTHAYVAKRPWVDEFLAKAEECFEVVIFTASLEVYADPLIDKLVQSGTVLRLFRSSCRLLDGYFVKDLSRLGRSLERVVIVDVRSRQNSPDSYSLHPHNAIGIKSWYSNPKDTALKATWRILEQLVDATDIPGVLSLMKRDLDNTADWSSHLDGVRGDLNSPIRQKPVAFSSDN